MMILRAALTVVLALGLLAAPLTAEAQPAGKVRMIGWLGLAAPTPEIERGLDPLRQGLRESGWIEGQTLVIEYRWAHGKPERLVELA